MVSVFSECLFAVAKARARGSAPSRTMAQASAIHSRPKTEALFRGPLPCSREPLESFKSSEWVYRYQYVVLRHAPTYPAPAYVTEYRDEVDRLLGEKGWDDWLAASDPGRDFSSWEISSDEVLRSIKKDARHLLHILEEERLNYKADSQAGSTSTGTRPASP